MVLIRDEVVESRIPMTLEELSRAELGEKKGYLRGFGGWPEALLLFLENLALSQSVTRSSINFNLRWSDSERRGRESGKRS